MMVGIFCVLFAAIQLTGVTGSDLRARAFFDANNVKVGDPLVLTVDFLGDAEFRDIHPPALARVVSKKDWKVDDSSAKTDTFRDGRRLTYRVRPMREGVVYFPALEFSYLSSDGSERSVRSNEIPVHAKAGAQVVVAEMGEDLNELPKPPELLTDIGNPAASDDLLFAWRKALAAPTAEKFATFDEPAARMNEATCAIREGNWARALEIYRRLEWRIGQTPEIERGIIAALALKFDSPAVELPIWRQVLRPLLKHDWKLRLGIVLGAFFLFGGLLWLLGRSIRALACIAVCALVACPLFADEQTVETVTTNADGSVTHRRVTTGGNGNFTFSFSSTSSNGGSLPKMGDPFGGRDPFAMMDEFDPFGRRARANYPKVEISASLVADSADVMVGESFRLVLTLDMPRYVAFTDGVRLQIQEQGKMTQLGPGEILRPEPSTNPTNSLQRFVFPLRANETFTNLHFSVEGEYIFVQDRSFFRSTFSYASGPLEASLTVRPLPMEGRPADFSGIIAESLALHEYCDLLKVETNDVVTIAYKLRTSGYVPERYQPKDVAYEWVRQRQPNGSVEIDYRRYFVADGAAETPSLEISYFDPKSRRYKSVKTGATRLTYGIIETP